MFYRFKLLLFLTLNLGALSAWAQDYELYEGYRSIRAMGMGGAYIAVVRDNDALYYNPAALRYMDGMTIELANIGFGLNGIDVYNDLSSFPSNPTPTDYDQLFGNNIWLNGSAKSTLTLPYFGFGVLRDYNVQFYARDPGFPTIKTYYKEDTVATLGFAVPLGPDGSMGFNLKRTQRVGGYSSELDPASITDPDALSGLADQFKNAGIGYGIDFATMYTVPMPLNPTVAIVWQDVGSTAFQKSAGTDAPPRIKDNISIGVGTLVDLPGFDWVTSLEYRHANNNGIDMGKKLHLGTEVSLPLIDLRAGYNQGYWSYGAGIDFWLMRFDAVSYTEEIGVYPGQNPDNRIMLGLTLDLSFDANFNFTDNKGRKRKLKQRR